MPLQEKARVLRLITSLMGKAVGQDTILPAKMTNHCKTLIPMGAGLVMGLEGRPLFTRPLEVSRHLQRLRTYGEERWAQRQRSKQAQKKARRDRAQGAKPQRNPATPADRRRCPAKGGAKRSALHYGTDFYAKPAVPDGRRHPPFQVVDAGPENGSQEPHTIRFTPQHARTRQRRPETHKRRRKTWVCEAHGHPPCRACAGTQGSAVLLCPRAPGAPAGACDVAPCRGVGPHLTAPPGGAQGQPEDTRTGGGGTTPSPQETRNTRAGEGGGAHTRGARRPEPAPPPAHGDEATEGRDTSPGRPAGQTSTPAGVAWAYRHRGLITPSRQRLWPRRG